MSTVKKAQAKKSVEKHVVKSRSEVPANTAQMIRDLRNDAESLLANADRLLTRLS